MSKHVTSITWDEVPHLTQEAKDDLWKSIPPYQRDARSTGAPSLGAGAIYPVAESEIVVPDREIPDHWAKGFGMDVGWNKTAGAWFARNDDDGVIYLYAEYYRAKAEPSVHMEGFGAKGLWIPGVIDPASLSGGQRDGLKLIDIYRDLGMDLQTADNAVSAGIDLVWQMLSTGQLKIFESCNHWREEFRLYRRDEEGKIKKEEDHLMDCTRYFILSGRDLMKTKPITAVKKARRRRRVGTWMGR